jgi:8-oxo-dGTP pyrophosphatase MutT (NUDIX family)
MTPSESPAAGAERELLEETGIDAAIFPLFELEYQGQDVQHVVHVFELISDAEPAHDFGEWQWSGWLPPVQVRKLADQRKLCPDTALVFARYSQRAG